MNNIILFSISSLVFLCCSCKHQQPSIKNSVVKFSSKKDVAITINYNPELVDTLLLEYYYWNDFKLAEGFVFKNSEKQTFTLQKPYPIGLYRLRYLTADITKEILPYYFIVNGIDSNIILQTHFSALVNGKANISPTKEKDALETITFLFQQKMKTNDSIKTLLSSVSVVDKKYYTKKNAFRELYELSNLKFYKKIDSVASMYQHTYVYQNIAKLLRKSNRYESTELLNTYENEPALLHETFWNYNDSINTAMLGHPLFFQSLQEYLKEYSGETNIEIQNAITYLMNKIAQPDIIQKIADYLIYYYLDRNKESLAQFVALRYIPNCKDDYVEQIKKSDRYKPIPEENTKMPILRGTQIEDLKQHILNDKFTESNVTIIYFWKVDCNFCEEEVVYLKQLESIFSKNKLQILAYSIESNPKDIVLYLKENKIDWNIYFAGNSIEQADLKNYAIKNTPTVFVVSKNGTIISNRINGKGLKNLIKTYSQ